MSRAFSKRLVLLVVLIMVVSLAAFGSLAAAKKSTEKVTLTMYTHYTSADEKVVQDYAMAEMKKIMPNVDLKIDIMPQDDGVKFKTYVATGNMPDIAGVNPTQIAVCVKSNSIIPLEKYIKELKIASKLTPSTIALLNQQGGHTWAMPNVNLNFAVIFVNKALFKQAGAKIPENFEEFLAAGKLLKDKKIVPLGIWLKETWPALQLFDMIAVGGNPKGMTDLDLSGTGKASDPAFQNAAKKISQLAQAGIISKDAFTMDYNQAVAQFENGQCAMLMCGNWMTQEFGDKLGDNATILLPYVFADAANANAVKQSGCLSGGGFAGGYAVAANSKYKDIAAKYAIQFALKRAEGRVVKTGEINTVLKKAPKSEKPVNGLLKEVMAALDKTKTMSTMGWAFESSQIQADLGAEVQKLYTGEYQPADFGKNVDAMLQKYRK